MRRGKKMNGKENKRGKEGEGERKRKIKRGQLFMGKCVYLWLTFKHSYKKKKIII